MKFNKVLDTICNVIIPLLLGVLIYDLTNKRFIPATVNYNLSDGIWAYALQSCILIVWDRKINIFWVILTFLFSLTFELLQYLHVIRGTGDVLDILAYFIFLGVALLSNNFFITIIYKPNYAKI